MSMPPTHLERESWSSSRTVDAGPERTVVDDLERRGRWWLLVSFLACPCHLPVTLGLLGTVLGGTAAGVALRQHPVVAGLLIAGVWVAGTGRGLFLVRRAERGGFACRL